MEAARARERGEELFDDFLARYDAAGSETAEIDVNTMDIGKTDKTAKTLKSAKTLNSVRSGEDVKAADPKKMLSAGGMPEQLRA